MSTVGGSKGLNAICPYFTMFPIEFPLGHLRGVDTGSWVLDPFCGRGTTAFAARVRHYPSFSTDVNPVAVAIARAKLANVDPRAIVDRARAIIKEGGVDKRPNGEFWELAYHSETLEAMLKLRRALRTGTSPVDDALCGILLGALHGPRNVGKASYLSNQMPRSFAPKPDYSVRYWKRRRLKPRAVDVLSVIRVRADRYFKLRPPPVLGIAILADARTLPDLGIRFGITITSPPYFGMNTYVPDQWLRAWFLGGPSKVIYRQDDQLARGSVEDFKLRLAEVWKRVGELSSENAKLVIRFGALASVKSKPREIIRDSLNAAGGMWELQYMKSAGKAEGKGRQANHMGNTAANAEATQEIDVVCRLR